MSAPSEWSVYMACALAAAAAGAFGADWPMLACNPQRTNFTPEPIEFPYEFAWERSFAPQRVDLNCQPIVSGGLVFIGTKSGNLYALDARTGKETWKYEAGGIIEHAAGVDNGRVFVACLDGTVHAVERATGKGVWKFRASSGFSASVLPVDGKVYLGARDGSFYSLDQASGALVWSVDFGAPVFNSAAWNNGRVYVGVEDMRLRCLDGSTGDILWTSEQLYGQSFRQFHPVIAGDSVAVMVMGLERGLVEGPGVFLWNPANAFKDQAEGEAWLEAALAMLIRGEMPDRVMADQEEAVKILTEKPEFQFLYILNEADGVQRYIAPSWRGVSMGGPTCPPALDCEGMLIVPVVFHGVRYARLDIEKGRIVDVLFGKGCRRLEADPKERSYEWKTLTPGPLAQNWGCGNMDEIQNISCAGPLVFFSHPHDSCHFTGTFDLRQRIYTDLKMTVSMNQWIPEKKDRIGTVNPFVDASLTRGQPIAIADGMFFHNNYGQIRAWYGAGMIKEEENNQ